MATIRALTADDYAGWLPLWQGYLRFYRGEVSDEVTHQTFRRLSGGLDGMTGLVAENPGGGSAGALAGLAHLVFHPSTWSGAPYCYLEDLYVAPPARGSGLSRQLIDAVYAEADRHGAARVYWETQEYNGAARSLYDLVAHRTSFVVYER